MAAPRPCAGAGDDDPLARSSGASHGVDPAPLGPRQRDGVEHPLVGEPINEGRALPQRAPLGDGGGELAQDADHRDVPDALVEAGKRGVGIGLGDVLEPAPALANSSFSSSLSSVIGALGAEDLRQVADIVGGDAAHEHLRQRARLHLEREIRRDRRRSRSRARRWPCRGGRGPRSSACPTTQATSPSHQRSMST